MTGELGASAEAIGLSPWDPSTHGDGWSAGEEMDWLL